MMATADAQREFVDHLLDLMHTIGPVGARLSANAGAERSRAYPGSASSGIRVSMTSSLLQSKAPNTA